MGELEVFAYDDALRRVDNDPELLRELVGIFLGEVEPNLASLRTAMASGDEKTFTRMAHSVKGAAANIGARRTSAIAARLEQASQRGRTSEIAALLGELEAAIREFTAVYQRISRDGGIS